MCFTVAVRSGRRVVSPGNASSLNLNALVNKLIAVQVKIISGEQLMSQFPNSRVNSLEYGHANTGEKLLTQFFHQVYLWMAVGIAVTALVSYGASLSPAAMTLVYGNTFGYIVLGLGAFAVSWFFPKVAMSASLGVSTAVFLGYCALMGLLVSGIHRIYPSDTIAIAFLMTGGVFGIMSLLGFILKIDLSKIGAIVGMTVLGLFVASIVNIAFVKNEGFSWFITYGVLAAFIILTATQTQALKNLALEHGADNQLAPRIALIGSLQLYIAFLNMFMAILRILASRR